MINIITDDDRITTLLDGDQSDKWCEVISDMVCDAIDRIDDLPDDKEEEKKEIMENVSSMIFLRRTLKGLGRKCQVMKIDDETAKMLTGDGTEKREESRYE